MFDLFMVDPKAVMALAFVLWAGVTADYYSTYWKTKKQK